MILICVLYQNASTSRIVEPIYLLIFFQKPYDDEHFDLQNNHENNSEESPTLGSEEVEVKLPCRYKLNIQINYFYLSLICMPVSLHILVTSFLVYLFGCVILCKIVSVCKTGKDEMKNKQTIT